MTVVVEHGLGKAAAMPVMEKALDKLLAGLGSGIEILDKKTNWNDSTMQFSFTGKVGYIAIPLGGTIDVAASSVTVIMDLPPMVKTFIGEEKIQRTIEKNVRELLASA